MTNKKKSLTIESTELKNTRECSFCCLDIPANATKCTHCGSHLNWRRYLSFSSNILALLIALVSVCTAAYTVYSNLSVVNNSKLEFAMVTMENTPTEFNVLATNSGTKPGAILNARFHLVVKSNSYGINLNPIPALNESTEPWFFAGNSSRPLRLISNNSREGEHPKIQTYDELNEIYKNSINGNNQREVECHIAIITISHTGYRNTWGRNVRCDVYFPMLIP